MQHVEFNQSLLAFLQASPTPFHAVAQMAEVLIAAGFQPLEESEQWDLQPRGRYFVVRNDSALVAFTLGADTLAEQGVRMVGAHTDSPCLRVKPQPELNKQGYFQLGVETYGGVLLNPWFDRDLSLAGRVTFRDTAGRIRNALIDYREPVAVIPSLAIHLDREANESRSINAQTDLPPILMRTQDDKQDFRALLLARLKHEHSQIDAEAVLDYELCLYDTQPPALVGLEQEFIASARLDNLLSCYTGLQSLLQSDGKQPCLLVCNDHEEVGSASTSGAQGPLLKSVLSRICPEVEAYNRMIARSMMISCDNAHGVHPNYADRHDANHGPRLNEGPVIKLNANQRYASNSETSALFRELCTQAEVPVQAFVVRSDMACGSTIGPITATEIGVRTLDVGAPQFAMHSIRELAGSRDAYALYEVLKRFYGLKEV